MPGVQNRVLNSRVEQLLKQNTTRISVEPIILTHTSFIKPDLIIDSRKSITIMDMSAVAGY